MFTVIRFHVFEKVTVLTNFTRIQILFDDVLSIVDRIRVQTARSLLTTEQTS